MRITLRLLNEFLNNAIEAYLNNERDALLSDVSERNTCARLAIYLEREMERRGLKGYYADTEYNRKQLGQVKTVMDDRLEIIVITSDLIVHSRGENISHDNLIAVEVKKSIRPQREKDEDRKRLRLMTRKSFDGIWSNDGATHPEHVCGYRVGFYLEIDLGKRELRMEYFQDGARTRKKSRKI